jgi:uncharacterized protein (TIGR02270 family)
VTAAEALGLLMEEHLEEADFLWAQREEALQSRDYDLGDLVELEERLAAHVDALLLMGAPAWEMLLPLLTGDEEGERFAAACVALASGEKDKIAAVEDALAGADAIPAGIAGALRHLAAPAAEQVAARLVTVPQAVARAAAMDALSFRRTGPDPEALGRALGDADPRVRAAAVTAAGRLRVRGLLMEVERALDAPEADVRRAALTAGLVLGSAAVPDRCRAAVDRGAEEADTAARLLGHLGDPGDLDRLVVAARDGHSPAAAAALGWLGETACMPVLIALCGQAETGSQVVSAVARLTGADPEAEGLFVEPPAEAPEEADEDDAAPEATPALDPERLATWWSGRAGDFEAGVRYRYGVSHDPERLRTDLAAAPLADRHGAALEMALAEPDGPWLETAAMGLRQRAAMEGGQ